jgi:hypothetical protein
MRRPGGVPSGVQPDHVPPEGPAQRGQRYRQAGHAPGGGQDGGHRHHQDDALQRRDHLAGLPGRQGDGEPRQAPGGDDEGVPHPTDGHHPEAHVADQGQAEHQDQEGVDLHVEAGAQGRGGLGTPGDLTVHPVQQQRHCGQGDDHGGRYRPGQRVHRQRERPADQQRAGRGDRVGRTEVSCPAAPQTRAQQRLGGRDEGQRRRPRRPGQADGRGQGRQQADLRGHGERQGTGQAGCPGDHRSRLLVCGAIGHRSSCTRSATRSPALRVVRSAQHVTHPVDARCVVRHVVRAGWPCGSAAGPGGRR